MGKTALNQESVISLEHGHPGCIRGFFHHLNHHKWHNVKRRLPYRRHSSAKLSDVVEDPGKSLNDTTDAAEEHGKLDAKTATSPTRTEQHGSAPKGMRSRIKALITEEVSKVRGRHRRSSSLPSSSILERTPSIHHLEEYPNAEVKLKDGRSEYQDSAHSLLSSLLDPLLPNISNQPVTSSSKTCALCAAKLATHYLRQTEVDKHGKRSFKDHTLLQDSSIYAIEPSKNASLEESKLFLNALDLLNMRKELFLKVLQDPNSSLCHHLHGHKASNQRMGLRKCASFPTLSSSGEGALMLNHSKNNQEVGSSTEGENKQQSENKQIEDHVTLGLPKIFKNQQNDKLIVKRFRSLKEKIKHAIKESKKERRRIIMDSILHKVPHGRRYLKIKEEGNIDMDTASEKLYNPGSSSRSDWAFGRSKSQQYRRTFTFSESRERYNRLLDLCCNREANHCISDSLRLKTTNSPSPIDSSPKVMESILPLQDLRSYSFSRIEGSLVDYSSMSSVRPGFARIPSIGSRRFGDQKQTSLENQVQSTASSEKGSRENLLEASNSFKDRREGISHHDGFVEPITDSLNISTPEKDEMVNDFLKSPSAKGLTPEDMSVYDAFSTLEHELSTDSPTLRESNIITSKVETPIYSSQLHLQVDARNEAEFNYVKYVLQLSGFSGDEFLGKWQSTEQPMDPSMFEEVEAQLGSSGNEENEGYYRMLLFDLVNEVLLDIYDRSFSYWPMHLTCRSHIHPMPVGYHVLEQVWTNIRWYIPRTEFDPSLDDAVSRDLAKNDGWMNIQFEAECVGLELEDLIFDDLLEEIVFS